MNPIKEATAAICNGIVTPADIASVRKMISYYESSGNSFGMGGIYLEYYRQLLKEISRNNTPSNSSS